MKKFLLVPSLLALLVVGVAHAQTTEEELPEPGMTPANPFYFLDEFGEWLRFNLFTYDDEAETDLLLAYADERVAELKAMDEEGTLTPEQEEKVLEKYQKLLMEFGK